MSDEAKIITPADPEEMNDQRAEWASAAVATFQRETGLSDDDGLDTALMDLLADIGHLCDREGLELGELLARASFHYNDETSSALAEEGDVDFRGPDGTQFDFLPDAAPRCTTCGQTYHGECLTCKTIRPADNS